MKLRCILIRGLPIISWKGSVQLLATYMIFCLHQLFDDVIGCILDYGLVICLFAWEHCIRLIEAGIVFHIRRDFWEDKLKARF